MNTTRLKTYAPKARRDFIAAVTRRATQYGLTATGIEPMREEGQVVIIAGQPYPKAVGTQRRKLVAWIERQGFAPVMEAAAYTWFNRFAAIRFMELHGYLNHGFRVLSHHAGTPLPEILEQAPHVDLPGLDKERVIDLKMDGTRDEDLYRDLLLAQCRALHRAMPFLFEGIDAGTELLLPDKLLQTDSPLRELVTAIPEADWEPVEIIGWLYQFYISEKKDQVIGKVVKSEDIPAATQLFTPDWIAQYLVQNSVGRLWLMANPTSTLAEQWPYYIQPAEQTPEVQAQLDALIQARLAEDGGSLNPETITVLDPAVGSGHLLSKAYDVLKPIYLERGYRLRDIPRLILEKNLYGLDIDDRAAQMAGFALLMKARADDRRLFSATDDAGNPRPPKLNVFSLQESKGLSADELAIHLAPFRVQRATVTALVEAFENAKTFGSLLQIPYALKTHLAVLPQVLALVKQSGDMYATAAADDLLPLVQQAQLLAMQFDTVIANPPYMGSKGMNAALKNYARATFPDSKSDLFAMFMERGFSWCKPTGFNSMVTMQSWMFLSSYQAMRDKLLQERTIETMAHLGARAFSEISGEVVQTTMFVLQGLHLSGFKPVFFRLVEGREEQKEIALRAGQHRFDVTVQDEFKSIAGSPIAYWTSKKLRRIFANVPNLGKVADTKQGLATTNNSLFLRRWHEIDISKAGFGIRSTDEAFESGKKWFPLNKGGSLRRWYGNHDLLINFENNGKSICDYIDSTPGVNVKSNGRVINRDRYFTEGLTWSSLASGGFSMRYSPHGFIFETKGAMCFPKNISYLPEILALFNTKLVDHFLLCLSPTLDYHEGPLKLVPTKLGGGSKIISNVKKAVEIAKVDWNSFETSWDFQYLYFVMRRDSASNLSDSWVTWSNVAAHQRGAMRAIEEENNYILIATYGLQDELSPEVPESQITLTRADREKDCQRLISYAIGCMMGRYSLDEPGLIYAHAGNVGFEPDRYTTFPADADGIVPINDQDWFADDACSRIREFLRAVWGPDTLEENLAWLAESLGAKATETPDGTIRRYLADSFFRDHLQTYKKRPIYWLFSSGKLGACQALVYLHRYHEGTLARLRMEYVVPLQAKMAARLDRLGDDIASATSSAQAKRLQKERDRLAKQADELRRYDEQLHHYADQRIALDLDDGVKVNYGKFGNLLAEVKTVTGQKSD